MNTIGPFKNRFSLFPIISIWGLAAFVHGFTTNEAADLVLGHNLFTQAGYNNCPNASTEYNPWTVYCDGTRLFVADQSNSRVLIWNSVPASNNTPADVVVGQSTMDLVGFVGSTPTAKTLGYPNGVFSDGTKLYISDGGNSRVLIYNSIPVTNNAAADVVIGQPNFVSNTYNQGQTLAGNKTLNSPTGVWSDGTKLFISDGGNNRVLIYNSIPVTNNAAANVVIGQPNMTSSNANQSATMFGPPAQNTLRDPLGISWDGSKLYIADQGNNRIMIYNGLPVTNNAPASVVVGQPDFISRANSISQNGLSNPYGAVSDGTHLYVNDGSNRILIYGSMPVTNGAPASLVIGQADFVSSSSNQGGSTAANTLSYATGIANRGTTLFIADNNNNRVLVYNGLPVTNNAPANLVEGQPNFTSSLINQCSGTAVNLDYWPEGVASDGTKLIVADTFNNRVLIYNNIPTSSGASADVVIGQPDFISNLQNQGAANPSSRTLSTPQGLYFSGTKLFIADGNNNRVLIYNSLPVTNNAPANVVVGQASMTAGGTNQGGTIVGPKTLNNPSGVFSDASHLYIADGYNQRVLIYNSIPVTYNAAADVVVGQPNFASVSVNQGGTPTANTLNQPFSASSDGSKLYVADTYNNRVLIYNSIPVTNNAAADVVVGQPNFAAISINQGNAGYVAGANTIDYPLYTGAVGGKLYISDVFNNRLLVYNSIPTANNASANIAIGQPDLVSNQRNQGGVPAANTLFAPGGFYTDGAHLYLADIINSRVLIYNTVGGPTLTPTSTPTITPTFSATNTPTNSPTQTPTYSTTPSPSNTPSNTLTTTATQTPTWTPTNTTTNTLTPTPSNTPTATPTLTPSPTVTPTPIFSYTPTSSPTITPTFTPSSTATLTPTATTTPTPTNSPSITSTSTPSLTSTNSPTSTPSSTPSTTPTPTLSSTPTKTSTPSPSNTPTNSPTNSPSSTPTSTTTLSPTLTSTSTPTNSATLTPTSTPTASTTATPTSSPTLTTTPTTSTTPTNTPTNTATNTATGTPTNTTTNSPTATASFTPTNTATQTQTNTPTNSTTSTTTYTPSSTPTTTFTPSLTFTPSNTFTPTFTPTITLTPTITFTPTITPTPNPNANLPFPNPWDGSQPLAFYHTVAPNTVRVSLKLFTVSFRKVYENNQLSISPGEHLYQLDWSQAGNIANGLYYLVLVEQSGGDQTRKIMKIIVRR